MTNILSDKDIQAIAIEYVQRTFGPSSKPVLLKKYEVPDGLYFGIGPDEYIGFAGFFVSRESGEICPLGSGHSVSEGIDYWLNRFAEGWRPSGS